jgi:Skp family chaperone for outer membrane proteins
MKKLLILFFLLALCGSAAVAQKKMTKAEMANFTPEQRMVYENSRKKKVNQKSHDSLKKKVKRDKKLDRKSRRLKSPKKPYTPRKH